ncbi:SDR family NAD(P)-dependent oxidoreductase [Ancylobacter lacus]|uniref:SDR family NAD(P)-dependent oxidoreductase n=1 Tax=Ancylobacter lacus TaxID=2579970 RepID=UPI001BCB888D|nr:SDR family NAD(P)-dependent oxidoreductase [Ancylobacter lacus]MBS7538408.1 SDR family NAD(P)-dependent oxidoreductase [Ancylobacter lacus]
MSADGSAFPRSLRPVLVTGGAGFIGSNLADRLAREGHEVRLLDSLARPGVERNAAWLEARHPGRVTLIEADIRDEAAVAAAVAEVQAVFHLAAQVAVTSSLADPRADFGVNLAGTVTLLEAVRARSPEAPVIFASTNKVYGDLGDLALSDIEGAWKPTDEILRARGIAEDGPLDFHTPYGCSKGAADQYVLDYARSFGLQACVMRMSCIYGARQFGTEDQGWVAHFLIRALEGAPIAIFGDGRQVRDILYVDDAVEAYLRAWRRIDRVSGRPLNLGGGPANAVSLLQLLGHVEALTGRPAEVTFHDWRAGDQLYYVSDTRRALRELELPIPVGWRTGVGRLADWLVAEGIGAAVRQDAALRLSGVL